jgi:hypothetical protein
MNLKLGDIKVEALRLMFMGGAMEIGVDQLLDYADDTTYGYYLSRMPGAINRAFSVIERRHVLPVKAVRLTSDCHGTARFDLKTLAPDLYDVARVSWLREGTYEPSADHHIEGAELLVPAFDPDADYTLVYYPCIDRVSAGTDDEKEIELPDEIAEVIPYAIKGDLFCADNEGEADAARAFFEAALHEIALSHVHGSQGAVRTTYGGLL